ncbi:MAG TPA: 16S rRNA (uracil(1498)-N(3))-methyltransferase [Steroidobacteraceae bacterium]|jgi:16S rRNA (uracil1498-N3)-methyltransferase|nr:16S rRNA (uracil(1498)-N(3))-methyltransferase [Steroidobacteraceae bacterium]
MNASLKRGRAMRLTRVYVDGALTPGSIIDLPRETGAHLSKVLRVRSGDELVLFNGDGREFIGAIDAVRGSRVSASIGAARSIDRESPCRLTLVQCIPRGDRMDFIVQKATELGVARIVPVLSQRSVVRLDAAQSASKQAHWRAVAVSACEQCGRNRLPTVEAPQPLLNYLGALAPPQPKLGEAGLVAGGSLRLVMEPEGERGSGKAQPIEIDSLGAIGAADIAIGPEGGFAPEELEAFQLSAFARAGLGPRVLRTETAAIAAIVMLQARFGDMSADNDPSRTADA